MNKALRLARIPTLVFAALSLASCAWKKDLDQVKAENKTLNEEKQRAQRELGAAGAATAEMQSTLDEVQRSLEDLRVKELKAVKTSIAVAQEGKSATAQKREELKAEIEEIRNVVKANLAKLEALQKQKKASDVKATERPRPYRQAARTGSGGAGFPLCTLQNRQARVQPAALRWSGGAVQVSNVKPTPETRGIRGYLADARLVLKTHWYYPTCLFYYQLPEDLFADLRSADLVILKGDANYRRLLGDARWNPTASFVQATAYFPAPFVSLRTLKAEVITGLPPRRAEQLDAVDPEWRVNGRRGVVQGRLNSLT